MENEARSKEKTTSNEKMDTSTADRGIVPAEVAARMDREGRISRRQLTSKQILRALMSRGEPQ
jgi:hypothetical protein